MTRRELLTSSAALLAARCGAGKAPDFAREDAAGATVRLSDYRGKVVLLDFWATWCGGCKVEIPWFIEFADAYKEKGLEVLGVAFDEEGFETVRPFLEERKVNYPVVIGDEEIGELYDVAALPKTLLIDRAGMVARTHVGLVDRDVFEEQILELLEG